MTQYTRTTLKDMPLRSAMVSEALIVSHMDPTHMGSLLVEILNYSGSTGIPERTGQLMTVGYLSPFYGVTPLKGSQPNDNYRSTQQSYGFWAIPPDPGTRVLVLFAQGHSAYGYWIGCIPDEGMNFMVPDPRSVTELTTAGTPSELAGQKLPVGEYNKKTESGQKGDYNFFEKPYNKDFTEVLEIQGLLFDEARGLTTASARRETPSMVFGWSTPGPHDKRTNSPDVSYGDTEDSITYKYSRLGGSSIVMDDGDDKLVRATHASEGPPLYHNLEAGETDGDITIPNNEGIRIRTRTGHQILLSNNEDLIYIGNSRGTAWIELTSDGKMDIHCEDSISVHTEQDFNLVAERDINMEAGRNVNIKAAGRWNEYDSRRGQVIIEANKNFVARHGVNSTAFSISGDSVDISVPYKLRIKSGEDLHIEAGGSLYTTATGSFQQKAGDNILTKASGNIVTESENTFFQTGNNLNISAGGDIKENAGGIRNIKAFGSLYVQSDGDLNLLGGGNIKTASAGGSIIMNSFIQPPSEADVVTVGELGSSPTSAQGATTPEALPKIPLPRIRAGSYDEITIPQYQSIVPRVPQHEPWPHHENLDPLKFKYTGTDRELLSSFSGYEFLVHGDDASTRAATINGEEVPIDFSYMGSASEQEKALTLYDAAREAGFSKNQAIALVGEIYRENSFRNDLLFGTHLDPANAATNAGIISWQGDRRINLINFMKNPTLNGTGKVLATDDGRIIPGSESLVAQFRFMKSEMNTIPAYNETKTRFLENPNVSLQDSERILGQNYIRWRINDPVYRSSGLANKNYGISVITNALADR